MTLKRSTLKRFFLAGYGLGIVLLVLGVGLSLFAQPAHAQSIISEDPTQPGKVVTTTDPATLTQTVEDVTALAPTETTSPTAKVGDGDHDGDDKCDGDHDGDDVNCPTNTPRPTHTHTPTATATTVVIATDPPINPQPTNTPIAKVLQPTGTPTTVETTQVVQSPSPTLTEVIQSPSPTLAQSSTPTTTEPPATLPPPPATTGTQAILPITGADLTGSSLGLQSLGAFLTRVGAIVLGLVFILYALFGRRITS